MPDPSHPLQHYDTHVSWESLTVTLQTRSIDANYSGGKTPLCYQSHRETHHSSFSDAFPALLTLSFWLAYLNAITPDPFFHIVPAQRCMMLIYTLAKILPLNLATLRALHAYNLGPSFTLFLAISSPEMSPKTGYSQNLSSASRPCLKVISFAWSFSWVGDSHRQC